MSYDDYTDIYLKVLSAAAEDVKLASPNDKLPLDLGLFLNMFSNLDKNGDGCHHFQGFERPLPLLVSRSHTLTRSRREGPVYIELFPMQRILQSNQIAERAISQEIKLASF